MKRLEKIIWIGVIPVTGAMWLFQRLRSDGAAAPSPQATVAEDPTPTPVSVAQEPAELEAINGIGPVYARRLRDAGITTYAALRNTSPQRLLDIVQATPGLADTEAWIEQARRLDGEKG